MGLKELSKYSIVELYLNSNSVKLADYVKKINPQENNKEILNKIKQCGYAYGTLKDLSVLFKIY